MAEQPLDVAVVGGGIAGFCTAARLQAAGLSTAIVEQHTVLGGCAGYYRRDGFAFDVGATTLVDFQPGGVGGQFLAEVDYERPEMTLQRAYDLWLPDARVRLHRDPGRWRAERRARFGDDERHRAFFAFVDDLAETLWSVTRSNVKFPIQSVADVVRNARAVGRAGLTLARYRNWTVADAMRRFGVSGDQRLRSALAMLVEDTVHSTLESAPLPNAVLGSTVRRVGLGRATGGMCGFWQSMARQYRADGGRIETDRTVTEIAGERGDFVVEAERGAFRANQVVSAVPVQVTERLAPSVVGDRLAAHADTVRASEGGAILVCLGVPEREVDDHEVTHHQLLTDYDEPLGNGNNMFVSVSGPEDDVAAPPGHRAVMLSTHCDVDPWQGLDPETYEREKAAAGATLVENARRVYPDLASDPEVYDVGTPVTYEAFTNRPRGAIGGYRQTLENTNQHAVPQDVGVDGFYLAGDTTWPGLGTVACVKGSAIAAEHVLAGA